MDKTPRRRLMLASLLLVLCACGGGGGDGAGGDSAQSAQIASVRLADGNVQSAPVGTDLPQPVVAQLLNAAGTKIAGQIVNFHVVAGGGRVFAGAAVSDADGFARERWTLGTVAGPQRLEVRAVDAAGQPVVYATFDAVAVAGPAAKIAVASGDAQVVPQIQALPAPVKVVVRDRYDNPVAGATVVFATDGGSPSPASATTNAAGEASTVWTVGPAIGNQVLTATVGGVPALSIGAVVSQAAPTAPVQFLAVSGDAQTAPQHTKPAQPLKVKVVDALGNGVPGVGVDFAAVNGSGYVRPETVLTDSTGSAVWPGYVHVEGVQRIQASAAGFTPLVFSVTVTASGSPYDGVYLITYPPSPDAPSSKLITIKDSEVVEAASLAGQGGPTFSQSTGKFDYLTHAGTSYRTWSTGQLTLDANGKATGTEYSYYADVFPPGYYDETHSGPWPMERL